MSKRPNRIGDNEYRYMISLVQRSFLMKYRSLMRKVSIEDTNYICHTTRLDTVQRLLKDGKYSNQDKYMLNKDTTKEHYNKLNKKFQITLLPTVGSPYNEPDSVPDNFPL